ncbi:monooxygenase [Leptospira perolatii]|uniref:Flavin-containing monooxygenase 5 n=1 Tax=Leptospira perolatii TaxID=2023191 RepID=A0A2M9ZRS2_9LEPT|nr:NAD(P)-binding domain-containing protein [Leptospira perolatii]PJZ71564.1 monooxygenase [Leptospira perolatii]PJZ74669.1 monooxygenase [Leptospira perolatii]
MTTNLPKVCVIGAGSSGITVCKSLQDKKIPFDCYEKGSEIGGNWRFKNDNGMSNIYKSLHINTHRERMEYSDYPMPHWYPDYPNHEPIQKYFLDYVNHFGIRKNIKFKTGVAGVTPQEDGTFLVSTDKGDSKFYDAVIVANGHHWSPRWPKPEFPGKFHGKIMHSHDYVDPEHPINLVGKKVVILGIGNSAMDISVELCRPGVAQKVFLSSRRGAWIIPNYLFGKPLDKSSNKLPPGTPLWIKRLLFSILLRIGVGKMEDFGLPKPDHRIGEAHPTVSQDILVRFGRGDIKYKPVIQEYKENRIRFSDGTEEEADAVIYCTGYDVKFPFFQPNFIDVIENHLPLFHRTILPKIPNLFFVGLYQPLGAVMPLAEFQGKWISEYLTGNYSFPSIAEMERHIKSYETKMRKRYVSSARHTMQVDFEDFLYGMQKELKRGRKKAAKSGHLLPIEAKAEKKSVSKHRPQFFHDRKSLKQRKKSSLAKT